MGIARRNLFQDKTRLALSIGGVAVAFGAAQLIMIVYPQFLVVLEPPVCCGSKMTVQRTANDGG